MQVIKITCPHCQLVMAIPLEAFPTDKQQVNGRCGGCETPLLIDNPVYQATQPIPQVIQPQVPQLQPKMQVPSNNSAQNNKTTLSASVPLPTIFKLVNPMNQTQYILSVGKNIIGKSAAIVIQGDNYISGIHCCIEIQLHQESVKTLLYDDGTFNNGKMSTNGTYRFENGEYKKLTDYDKIILNNNTRIRIGQTELIYQQF
jgi:hypothetical protein